MTDATVIVVPETVAPVEAPVVLAETLELETEVAAVSEKIDALIQHEISDDKQLVISALGEFRAEFAAKFEQLFNMVGDIAAATVVIAEEAIADIEPEITSEEVVTEVIEEETAVVDDVVQERNTGRRSYFIK